MKFPGHRNLLFAAATLAAAASHAANTDTWVGNSGTDWNNAANWSPSALPAAGDSLVFGVAGSSGATLTDTLSGASFFGITFNSGASAYTTGGNAFTLTGGITNNSTSLQILGQAITLSGADTITTTAAGGNVTLSGVVGGAGGLTVTGSGTTTLSGANTYTGATAVNSGTLVVNVGSTGRPSILNTMSVASGATLNFLNNNAAGLANASVISNLTLSGAGTVITSGTGASDFWDGTPAVNLSAFTGTFHATGGMLIFQTGRTSGMNAMILDSGTYLDLRTNPDANGGLTLSSLAGTGIIGSSYTAGMVLTVGATGATSQFDGVIQNTVPGYTAANNPTIALTKIGAGTLTLTGANTYTGATTVNGGMLSLDYTTNNTNKISGALVLGGGGMTLTGNGTANTTQTETTTTLNPGGGTLNVNTGSGSGNITFALGTISQTTGGTLGVVYGGAGTGAASATTSSSGAISTTGILGPWAFVGTGSGTAYATVSGGNIVAYTGATPVADTSSLTGATTNYDLTGTSTVTATAATANTIRYVGTGAGTSAPTGLTANGLMNVSGALWTIGSPVTIGANKELVVNTASGDITIGGLVANNGGGASALTKLGAGTLTLGSTTTTGVFTGAVSINGGTLVYPNYTGYGYAVNNTFIGTGGTMTLQSSAISVDTNAVNAGTITGTGTLNKVGSGYLDTISGFNVSGFTGQVNVLTGVLGSNSNANWANAANTVKLNVASGAAFDVRTGTVTVGELTGAGNIGTTYNQAVTLAVGNDKLNTTFGGVIQNTLTYAGLGNITGGGNLALTKNGVGTLTLTGANTYSGGTTISAGTLQVGAGGTTGSLGSGAVTDNGALSFNLTNSPVVANAISGTGSVTQAGTGTLTLTGANSYSGGTTVSAGTLQIGGAGTTGSLGSGAVTDNGALSFNLTNALSVAGVISGSGTVTQAGSGTLTLSGANTYTGATTISAGTLNITGSLTSAIALNAGKLMGGGSTTGAVTVASGAAITAGNGTTGSLTIGNLTFAGTGVINIGTLGNYTSAAAVNATGALTLNGGAGAITLNLSTAAVASNTYILLSFGGGTVTTGGFTLGTGPALTTRQSGTLAVNGNNLDYVVAGDSPKWTGAQSSAWTTATVGGASNWKLITGGGTTDYIQGDAVLFDDSATTTTVNISTAAVSPTTVTFNNSTQNYTITGGFGIAGTGSLALTGTGTVTIDTANSYSGGTTISSGTLVTGTGTALGTGGVSLNGGTLNIDGQTLANAVTLGGGAFVGAGTLSGVISGGALTYNSSGNTLTLSGVNTYTGGTTLTAGTLQIGGSGSLGSGSYAGTLALSSGTTFIDASSANQTLSGVISGAGALTQSGSGTLTLSGANTFTGGVLIHTGTLKLGASGALGSNAVTLGSSGDVNPTLDFGGFSPTVTSLTVGSNVTGAKILANTAWGPPVVSGAVTLNSALTINAGTITGGGNAGFENDGKITGIGGGSGNDTLIFNYTGGAGAFWWQMGSAVSDFSGNIHIKGGQLGLQGFVAGTNQIIPDAAMVIIDSGATMRWNNFTYTVNETIDGLAGAGTLNVNTANATVNLTISANNTANDAARSFTGSLSGINSLTLGGADTQEFSGSGIAYTGATALNSGTLKLTDTTAWNSAITLGGSNSPKLQLNNGASGSWTLGKAITGGSANATVEKIGAGTVTLNGANTYSGSTLVTAGTLIAGSAGAFGSSNVSVASGATLQVGAAGVTLGNNATIIINGTLVVGSTGINGGAGTAVITTTGAGAYTFNGTLNLNGLFNTSTAGQYTLITGGSGVNTDTSVTITGFSNALESAAFSNGILTLTAVPEPSTYGLIGAGTLAAVAFVRRRRRSRAAGPVM